MFTQCLQHVDMCSWTRALQKTRLIVVLELMLIQQSIALKLIESGEPEKLRLLYEVNLETQKTVLREI